MRKYPDASTSGQGPSRHPLGPAAAQQSVASGLPVLSDSSEDEDDLPLPGSTSNRAMSVLQKYLSGTSAEAPSAQLPSATAPGPAHRSHAVTAAAVHALASSAHGANQVQPRAGQGRAVPSRAPVKTRAPAASPSGYNSDSDHSQMNGAAGAGLASRSTAAPVAAANDDMDMSPIIEHNKGDALESKAFAKLPAQVLIFYC